MQAKSCARAVALALAAGTAWPAHASGAHQVTVSAVILSKNTCRFSTAASSINLPIDPASGSTASASGVVTYRCIGTDATAVWSLTDNGGQFNSGGKRMQHATNAAEFLPYTLAYPLSGSAPKNATQTITVTASVTAASFRNAQAGAYADTVVLSISP